MENRLCTSSGGARFTHCGLQNPLLLPLTLSPPLRFPPQSQPTWCWISPPVPATQATVPASLPHSFSECRTIVGILGCNVPVFCIEDTLLVARLGLRFGLH